jgi:hypothetical protein
MKKSDGEVRTDPEATYRAIGRFMFEFSQLEFTIRIRVALEAGIKDEHLMALMTHDFAILCTAALEVLLPSLHGKETKEGLRGLINDCRKLNNVRVRVAHGLWVPFDEGGTVHHVSRSNLKPSMNIDQAKHLEAQADEANRVRASFERLMLYQKVQK